jgi:hypothetical protein
VRRWESLLGALHCCFEHASPVFPKDTDIPSDPAYLWTVARELNNRPRAILDYRTPAEVFAELLTSEIASTG